MQIVKNEEGKVLGAVVEATVRTLRTMKTPFVAVAPSKYHGLKRHYSHTFKEAETWVKQEGGNYYVQD